MIVVCKRKNEKGLLDSVFDLDFTRGAVVETDLADAKSVVRKVSQIKGAGFDVLVVPVGTTPELYGEFRRKHPDIPVTRHFWPRISCLPAGDVKTLGETVGRLLTEVAAFFRGNDLGTERIDEDE
jgi:hypothetical protein